MGPRAVKGTLSKLRTSTQKVLRDHEQEQERIAQEKVLEQKRVEQAKIAAAQQKARQEEAAEAARRAALKKDTRYTRAMERYWEMDRDGSARTLRDHYREAAIAANLNRGRTPSPPRSILGMGLDQDITTASISKITRHFVRDEFGLSANTAQHIGDGVAFVAGAGLANTTLINPLKMGKNCPLPVVYKP